MSVTFSTPTLETERLVLRAPKPSDTEVFVEAYAADRMKWAGGPKTPKEAWRLFGLEIGHWVLRGFGMFVVTLKGEDHPRGIVGNWFPHGWAEKEVGWVILNPADEGKGIAYEAAKACVAHAFGPLGWKTAVSYIHPVNASSIALAERLGARLDPDAPMPEVDSPCVIYRHPKPAGLA
jgi:RimJ/RimL family protein N-acetyltransferase